MSRDFLEVPNTPILSQHSPRDEGEWREAMAGIKAVLAEMRERAGWSVTSTRPSALKIVSDTGQVEGLAAVYSVVDAQGDVILPGAFKESLKKRTSYPLLFNHDISQVIGIAEVEDSRHGLMLRGQLNLNVGKAMEIWQLIKQRAVEGLSIGYTTVRSSFRDGARVLEAVNLFEVSLTAFPANELARVSSVKSSVDGELEAMELWFRNTVAATERAIGHR